MRYVDEYRNEADARRLLGAIRRRVTRSWSLMEICGGQTHTFVRSASTGCCPTGHAWSTDPAAPSASRRWR
jgi:hydrogenase expression/formation protein HypD